MVDLFLFHHCQSINSKVGIQRCWEGATLASLSCERQTSAVKNLLRCEGKSVPRLQTVLES